MPRGRRRGILGFSVPDVVAVRELMEHQPPRRREICELLATGCSQREAAEWLGISPPTVHEHVEAVRRAFVAAGFDGAPVQQKRRRRRSSVREHRKRRRGGRQARRAHAVATPGATEKAAAAQNA